jgi:hypothetical protein
LKAYKLLAQLRGQMLSRIEHEAKNKTEYCKDKPEKSQELMEYISNPAKWDHCGLLSKEDKKVLETLEYLLNDDAKEIKRYTEWKPIN